jgi:DNA (cytosine-5)-methyltransferase 1
LLLSLFCGAGGLDLGFERAGYDVGLAFDLRKDAIASYNRNRPDPAHGYVQDVSRLTLPLLDKLHGAKFTPEGVIGGPPCQSFSRANTVHLDADPRHSLPLAYADLLKRLNKRKPVKFFVMENVTGLMTDRHKDRLRRMERRFEAAGFSVSKAVLLATDYGTPQIRERLFVVGVNTELYGGEIWQAPDKVIAEPGALTVKRAIGHLPDATRFEKHLTPADITHHPNHWCMQPRSQKFSTEGALTPGDGRNRSFKTLHWEKPSLTVAYGHREVHVHPTCTRRLSVYEAMLLQGFPEKYVLQGSLSSQIVQVSEAVPPPLAQAVAESVKELVATLDAAREASLSKDAAVMKDAA